KGYTRASGVTDAAGHAEREGLERFFNERFGWSHTRMTGSTPSSTSSGWLSW
ncbi:unnamed protein product, partial [Ectocarpus sp. 8 AP-2014]